MSDDWSPRLQPGDRVPMSWEEFWALDEDDFGDFQAEYIDGHAIVKEMPTILHQRSVMELVAAIHPVLDETEVVLFGVGWKPSADCFIPDALLFGATDEEDYITDTARLAIEVLGEDREHDTKLKFAKYAEVGLERYWIVDPDGPTITVYHLDGDTYTEVARHEPGAIAELDIGVATITLDPAELVA